MKLFEECPAQKGYGSNQANEPVDHEAFRWLDVFYYVVDSDKKWQMLEGGETVEPSMEREKLSVCLTKGFWVDDDAFK